MDLRQLRTFLAVADQGSLTRAADSLHVAQPALGRQVRQLEEEFAVALFERHGRGMVLTATGRLLADRARTILRLVEDTRAEVAAGRDAVTGGVTLGLPPTVGEVLAARLVERFLQQHPAVTVRIVPAFSGYLHDLLRRGEVDLAVMYETAPSREISTSPLIGESLCLVGTPERMAAWRDAVRLADLAGRPLVLPGPRQGLRALLEAEASKAGLELKVVVEADSLQTLKDLAARDIGMTVLPMAAVHGDVARGILAARAITEPEPRRRLVLARSLARPMSNAVRIFAGTLRAETEAMVREGIWQGELPDG